MRVQLIVYQQPHFTIELTSRRSQCRSKLLHSVRRDGVCVCVCAHTCAIISCTGLVSYVGVVPCVGVFGVLTA